MITLLSPSKTQNYTDHANGHHLAHTLPALLPESERLVDALRRKSVDELMKLMNISSDLAGINQERYQQFSLPFTPENARPALLAFRGDVYTDIATDRYTPADYSFAQDHVRILSGLYGLLCPLDLIQPYRLEMKTALSTTRGNNLYQFWGDRITHQLNKAFQTQENPTVVNLASQEYSKAIRKEKLASNMVTPLFKEDKNGKLSTVAVYAKRARGKMANFIVERRIDKPELLKTFSEDHYEYSDVLSTKKEWVFVR